MPYFRNWVVRPNPDRIIKLFFKSITGFLFRGRQYLFVSSRSHSTNKGLTIRKMLRHSSAAIFKDAHLSNDPHIFYMGMKLQVGVETKFLKRTPCWPNPIINFNYSLALSTEWASGQYLRRRRDATTLTVVIDWYPPTVTRLQLVWADGRYPMDKPWAHFDS